MRRSQAGEVDNTSYVCDGSDGSNGSNGSDGFSALAVLSPETAGLSNFCFNGGQRLDIGVDNGSGGSTASDGLLQSGEITDTTYLCDVDNIRRQLRVDSLGLSGCNVVDQGPSVGGHRGGLALTTYPDVNMGASVTALAVSGDSATQRLDVSPTLATAATPMTTTTIRDGILPLLAPPGGFISLSEDSASSASRPFSFGATPTATCEAGGISTTFNSVVAVNADTGAYMMGLSLSQPITINGCLNGIFGGPNFVIVMTDSNFYYLDFKNNSNGTAAVTDLGARPAGINPPIATSPTYNCENWAFQGVAEYDGKRHSILYRDQNSQRIMRFTLCDLAPTTLVDFASLGDASPLGTMCSFTLDTQNSLPGTNGRWYFDFGGATTNAGLTTLSAQGPTSNTAASCDASVTFR